MTADLQQPRPHRPIGYRPAEISSLFNTRVVAEHASSAAFLWTQREKAARAPHYKLKHLARLDERVHAHLHGLRVAGPEGWRAAMAALEQGNPGTVFVSSYLAFASGKAANMRDSLYLGLSEAALTTALESALLWLEWAEVGPAVGLLQASSVPAHQRVALSVLCGHRIDAGEFLTRTLESDDAALRARALQAAGELKRRDLTATVRRGLGDTVPACRFWAAYALTLLGAPEGPASALDNRFAYPAELSRAIDVVMRHCDWDWARQMIRSLARQPETLRSSVLAAAAFGDPAVIPWLLGLARQPALARVAAEAISTITGADLHELSLIVDPPEDPPPDLDPQDDDLPWPNVEKLTQWWDAQNDYMSGQRYLGGQLISEESCIAVLRTGYQRQRGASAHELARLSESAPLFSVTDRADRQRRRLAM